MEIRIPRTGDEHADLVQQAKDLVLRVGKLEFRILANSVDDAEAIKDARAMFAGPMDAAKQKELVELQEKGLPPPGPRDPKSLEPRIYEIRLPGDNTSQVTYSWLELGPQKCQTLELDNAIKHDPLRNHAWLQARKLRGQATTLSDGRQRVPVPLLQGALFYSRNCENRNLTEDERWAKSVDYFVLSRDPEIDPTVPAHLPLDKRRTARLDGSFLQSASAVGTKGRSVEFSLNGRGTELFHTLTRKNLPSSAGPGKNMVQRHLAIVLDGIVMSAPTIHVEVIGRGHISGDFTARGVQDLANILRAGALPTRLKPLPVSEEVVGPKQ